MRSSFRDKPLRSLRRLNVAGRGLPERMRSTAFAFLGLTAAAGLALVAFFAQLGFPLLAPAPLPSSPQPSAVGRAVPLATDSPTVAVAQAQGAVAGSATGGRPSRANSKDGKVRAGRGPTSVAGQEPGSAPAAAEPTESTPPAVAPDPPPNSTEPSSPPEQAAAPAVVPVVEPAPATAVVKEDKSKLTPAKSKPAKSKPAKSEEKPDKTKPDKEEPEPVSAPTYQPAQPPPPAADKGEKDKEKGYEKDKAKKDK